MSLKDWYKHYILQLNQARKKTTQNKAAGRAGNVENAVTLSLCGNRGSDRILPSTAAEGAHGRPGHRAGWGGTWEVPAHPEKEHCEEQDIDDVIISTEDYLLTCGLEIHSVFLQN